MPGRRCGPGGLRVGAAEVQQPRPGGRPGRRALGLAAADRFRRRRRPRPGRLLPRQAVQRDVLLREPRRRSQVARVSARRRISDGSPTQCPPTSAARSAFSRPGGGSRVPRTGLDKSAPLPLPANVHPNRVRANQWRYVDYDGDGRLDLVVGVERLDRLRLGQRLRRPGPMDPRTAARLRLPVAQHRHGRQAGLRRSRSRSRPAASRSTSSACPRRTSPISTATAISTCSAASSSTGSPTSRTSARARRAPLRRGPPSCARRPAARHGPRA